VPVRPEPPPDELADGRIVINNQQSCHQAP
jgi:hypothetical protein